MRNALRRNSTILLPPTQHGWFSRNRTFTLWVLAIAILTPILLLVVVSLPIIVNFFAGDDVVHHFIEDAGWPAAVVTGVVYTILTVFLVPAPILALGVGMFCIKLWIALVVGYVGALSGACIAFLIGRQKWRLSILERFTETTSFLEVDSVINSGRSRSWMVVLLRFSPLMSSSNLNYALALTVIKFPQFFIGTLVGLAPYNVLSVFLSWTSVHAFTSTDVNSLFINLYVYGSAATLSIGVTVILSSCARAALVKVMYHHTESTASEGLINEREEPTGTPGEEHNEESHDDGDNFVSDDEKLRNSFQMTRSR